MFLLYRTIRASGMDDTSRYPIGVTAHLTMKTVRQELADIQADLPKGYESVWRIMDFSRNGGWCDESPMAWKIIKSEAADAFDGLIRE